MTGPIAEDTQEMVERRFLLVKRGLYYRPNGQGYTGIKEYAGRYLEADACPASGVTAVHEDEAPMFSANCFDDMARGYLEEKLAGVVGERDALRREIINTRRPPAHQSLRLAYGLLWHMQIDTSDDNMRLAVDARKALLTLLTKEERADGITRAKLTDSRFTGAA